MKKKKEFPRDPQRTTPFLVIYESFFSRITDEMYMELTQKETYEMLQDLLLNNLSRFEFPRFDLFDYEEGYWTYLGIYEGEESDYLPAEIYGWVGGEFNTELTNEEINILALNMVIGWLGLQLENTDNTELKYSSADFKFTSQANHMAKLNALITSRKADCLHLQRIYKRRIRTADGKILPTIGKIMEREPLNDTKIWGRY